MGKLAWTALVVVCAAVDFNEGDIHGHISCGFQQLLIYKIQLAPPAWQPPRHKTAYVSP
jgi:hypothetical protein